MKGVKNSTGQEEAGTRWFRSLLLLVVVAYLGMALYQAFKPLPEGINMATPLRPVENVAFLGDATYLDKWGQRRSEQVIFDEILRLIGQANRLVVLDMFLFNDFAGESTDDHRALSSELTRALTQRKDQMPGLEAVLITDPLNTLYGALEPDHLQALRAAGVKIVMTDLTRLRASNPFWSGFWYWCCSWLGNSEEGGWLPNPLGQGEVTLRSYLQLLNFNANHRKTLVVDSGESWTGLVTSANPHDASSAHDNVALRFQGPAAIDLLKTERAVVRMSGGRIDFDTPVIEQPVSSDGLRLQVLTESRIRNALRIAIDSAELGDRIDIAVFYFSHRQLLESVISAHERGVRVRVLLDPNRDAFGLEKNGIPNRQAATGLHRAGVPVRWCATTGEQCHSKLLLKRSLSGDAALILGSANFTRRNLDNLNLETSVRLKGSTQTPAITDAARYFLRYWRNSQGRLYSLPYSIYADPSPGRYWLYRVMEATGLSTF
ncbi:PLD-like domain-containing protein [Modicisalibacter ilicicola DSM 19980]|uniref:phospholipase D n=1 Tax=Modicisalibacter ilicicola DSM 19980 TaxID=1121942 RepID=A0A1M4ZAR4_9GAMM|nr:phospholipase D-like domain-containing protein [Halomonas ilicicola]SHF14666.1 PLD-like domain-containing protein [Halomonas ilicicola DSM 19980]